MKESPSPNNTQYSPEGAELQLVAKALSDPIRIKMADLMAQGRGSCCPSDTSSRGVPGSAEPRGLCVCELQDHLGLSQSRVSYHLRVMREAGLIDVETRGKWAFYSLRANRLRDLIDAVGRWLQP